MSVQIEIGGASELSHKSAEGLVNSKLKPLLLRKMPEVAPEDTNKVSNDTIQLLSMGLFCWFCLRPHIGRGLVQ